MSVLGISERSVKILPMVHATYLGHAGSQIWQLFQILRGRGALGTADAVELLVGP
jgi:hypothetical protein